MNVASFQKFFIRAVVLSFGVLFTIISTGCLENGMSSEAVDSSKTAPPFAATLVLASGAAATKSLTVPARFDGLTVAPESVAWFTNHFCSGPEVWETYSFSKILTTTAPDETKYFSARLKTGATISACLKSQITLDQTAPTSLSLTPGVALPATSASVVFTATASDSSLPLEVYLTNTVGCAGGGAWSSVGIGLLFNIAGASSFEGTKNIYYKVQDSIGNVSACTSLPVTIDTILPTVTLNALATVNNAQKSALTVGGACSEDRVNGISIGIVAQNGGTFTTVYADCVAGAWTKVIDVSALTDGNLTFSITPRDAAGNTGAVVTRIVLKDIVSPVGLAITSPGANTADPAEILVAGNCETGLPAQLSGDISFGPLIASCVVGNFSMLVRLSGLNGEKNVVVSQVDLAGNSSTQSRQFVKDDSSLYQWRTMRVGGGGLVTGLDIGSSDGTKVVRMEKHGAFFMDGASWRQLLTSAGVPGFAANLFEKNFVEEIRISPSNTNRFYMLYGGELYRSNDRGLAWTKTAFAKVAVGPDLYKSWGQKIAIDPANANVVYVGTSQSGLWVTSDAGTSWSKVIGVSDSAINGGVYPGITAIAFDTASGLTGGKTNTIYANSYGNGTYRSTDAGATWSAIAGGPANARQGKVAANGNYFVIGDDGSKVWRYAGSWTDITPAGGSTWSAITINPGTPAHIVAATVEGYINISTDSGDNWGGTNTGSVGNPISRTSMNIPWLSWTKQDIMPATQIEFDPGISNRIWMAEGLGVWYSSILPTQEVWRGPIWEEQTLGIESLSATEIIAPPTGKVLVTALERPFFRIANTSYASTHGPDRTNAIVNGWSIDYAAALPSFIVGLFNAPSIEKSGYSADGGVTWNSFATMPAHGGLLGGSIAVSSPGNIVWVPEQNGNPFFTNDAGASWTQISIPGVATTGETGWGASHLLNRRIVTADRFSANTFYMYNYLNGLFRSTNGGSNWTLMRAGELAANSQFHARLESVPGHMGHLFFSSGPQDAPLASHPAASSDFTRSIDGGANWTNVSNVKEVRAFGFGKALYSSGYPTIYIVGWVSNIYGIYRSNDQGANWFKIGDYPQGTLDQIKTISGDMNNFGPVYVGFQGSGFMYFGP